MESTVLTQAKILLKNQDITKMSESDLATLRGRTIGFIFQQYNLIPCLNVIENIEVQASINEKYDREYINKIIEDLRLTRILKEWPESLSGGEQQRVAIARALAAQPKILFADEPTGSLDEKNARLVLDMLLNINKKYNTSLVVITHSLAIASKLEVCLELKSRKVSSR